MIVVKIFGFIRHDDEQREESQNNKNGKKKEENKEKRQEIRKKELSSSMIYLVGLYLVLRLLGIHIFMPFENM